MSKNINIKINADSSNAEKGFQKATAEMNKLKQSINKSSIGQSAQAFATLAAKVALVTKSVKLAVNAMKDLHDSALKQITAEKQLESSAKNNPYLDSESVDNLKQYATQLQKISTVGDEELLPMMSKLASAGRTQTEIQTIMSTALDLSASGTMSLESAVSALNATYSGTTTQLAKTTPEIKSLTSEELKNGKAVEIISKKYKGISQDLTNATGSSQQLKNAWGDLKESLGMGLAKAVSPIQKAFTAIIEQVNKAVSTVNKFVGLDVKTSSSSKLTDTLKAEQKELESIINDEQSTLKARLKSIEDLQTQIEKAKSKNKVNKKGVGSQDLYIESETKRLLELEKERNEIQEKINKAKSRQKEIDNEILDAEKQIRNEIEETERASEKASYTNSSDEELENKLAKIKAEYKAREELTGVYDEQQYHLDRLNAMTDNYISLIADSNGLVTTSDNCAKDRIKRIKEEEEALAKCCESESEYLKIIEQYATVQITSPLENLKNDLQTLQKYKKLLEDTGKAGEESFNECSEAIDNIQKKIDDLEFDNLKNQLQTITDFVVNQMSELSSAISSLCDAVISKIESQCESETTALQEQYESGLISYEEYCDEKYKIQKEAAIETYKIELAEWQMNIAMALAQGAQAVLQAIANLAPPYSWIAAGVSSAMATAEIATLMANKPTMPSFSTGGFLTGSSTSGDKIAFMGNAGEAILNPAEQRNFMAMANGTYDKDGITMNVMVENNASDIVQTSQSLDGNSLKLVIDRVVSEGLVSGKYSDGVTYSTLTQGGTRVL